MDAGVWGDGRGVWDAGCVWSVGSAVCVGGVWGDVQGVGCAGWRGRHPPSAEPEAGVTRPPRAAASQDEHEPWHGHLCAAGPADGAQAARSPPTAPSSPSRGRTSSRTSHHMAR